MAPDTSPAVGSAWQALNPPPACSTSTARTFTSHEYRRALRAQSSELLLGEAGEVASTAVDTVGVATDFQRRPLWKGLQRLQPLVYSSLLNALPRRLATLALT